MRVEPTKQVARQQIDNTPDGESRQNFVNHDTDNVAAPGRAVVAVTPDTYGAAARSYRPATFLAHLIATRDQAPQTRERRRATPRDAAAAYRTVAALVRG